MGRWGENTPFIDTAKNIILGGTMNTITNTLMNRLFVLALTKMT